MPKRSEPKAKLCSDSDWNPEKVIRWLFSKGRLIENKTLFVTAFARKLTQVGAPVDRLLITMLTIHPQVVGLAHTWRRDSGKTVVTKATHETLLSERYIGSPIEAVMKSGKRVRQNLNKLPKDAHAAYLELAQQGFVDYLALPIFFGNKLGSAILISTQCKSGFSDSDIENFRYLRDYLAPILEVYILRYQSIALLDTYVGERTSKKILAGMIKRGDADKINAALWFSDLRNFTHLSETLSSDQVLDMLNEYFEFVSAAVTARGGEILRFIGDAMLIVFPIGGKVSKRAACRAAIESAIDARTTLASINHYRRRQNLPAIEFGVGLNVGDVVYGNGSTRLHRNGACG